MSEYISILEELGPRQAGASAQSPDFFSPSFRGTLLSAPAGEAGLEIVVRAVEGCVAAIPLVQNPVAVEQLNVLLVRGVYERAAVIDLVFGNVYAHVQVQEDAGVRPGLRGRTQDAGLLVLRDEVIQVEPEPLAGGENPECGRASNRFGEENPGTGNHEDGGEGFPSHHQQKLAGGKLGDAVKYVQITKHRWKRQEGRAGRLPPRPRQDRGTKWMIQLTDLFNLDALYLTGPRWKDVQELPRLPLLSTMFE